jgi:hypothetical protein
MKVVGIVVIVIVTLFVIFVVSPLWLVLTAFGGFRYLLALLVVGFIWFVIQTVQGIRSDARMSKKVASWTPEQREENRARAEQLRVLTRKP